MNYDFRIVQPPKRKLILNHIEAFYKDLLESQIPFNDDTYDNFVQNLQLPKLSDDERDKLEGPLKFDECKLF